MINALSVDVEDYFQISDVAGIIDYKDWDNYQARVVENTKRILCLLGEFKIKATFFVLGWIAERHPDLIKEIYSEGHEIACHGYRHKLIYKQTPLEFREDVRRAKSVLEKITGERIKGFRAPTYSIQKQNLWALKILSEEGFEYDSSVLPVWYTHFGLSSQKYRFIQKIDLGEGRFIIEFPLSTIRILGINFAFCGGGYLRLYPLSFIKWAIKKINQQGYPVMIYFHPWEIDCQPPQIGLRGIKKIKYSLNLSRHIYKIEKLLSESCLNLSTVQEVIKITSN